MLAEPHAVVHLSAMSDTPRTNIPPSADLSTPAGFKSRLAPSHDDASHRMMLLILRLVFLVLLVTMSLLPFVGEKPAEEQGVAEIAGVVLATLAVGVIVVLADIATPNKRLSAVFGVYLGIMAGLVGALAIGALIDLVADSWDLTSGPAFAYRGLIKFVIGITMCYLGVSIVLTTKDDIRLAIPYVEFAKQVRGVRPMLLDTSVIIDGRVEGLGPIGFLDAPLILPQFVIDELQTLADSGDKLKRERGRRGLGIVTAMQENPYIDLSIDNTDVPGKSVDHKLLALAADHNMRILSTDYNLNKVGRIQGVQVLNLNDLASELKGQAAPGDTLRIHITRVGESPDQGVGYLPDGTMVVVEDAGNRVGNDVEVEVSNSLQTTAGRMIFAKPMTDNDSTSSSSSSSPARPSRPNIADAATNQPRATQPPPPPTRKPPSRRNPRR